MLINLNKILGLSLYLCFSRFYAKILDSNLFHNRKQNLDIQRISNDKDYAIALSQHISFRQLILEQ